MRVQYLISKNGLTIPQLEIENRIFRLHSLYDPIGEGAKMGIGDEKANLIFALGVGFGYHLKPYQEAKVIALQDTQTTRLLATDENPNQGDGMPYDLTKESHLSQVKKIIQQEREKNPNLRFQWMILAGYQKAFKEYCEKVYQIIMEWLKEEAKEEAVIRHFLASWQHHFRRNQKKWREDPQKYSFKPLDFTAQKLLIVAAGPSLDFHFDSIRALQKEQWQILSTDTAFLSLLTQEIFPDYLITIDTQHHSLMHYIPALEQIKEKPIKLIKDIFAHPTIDALFDEIYPLFPPQKELIAFSKKHQLPLAFYETGGNVTHAAISVALSAGAKQIRLFAADFANFYEGKESKKRIIQTHCKNSGYFFQIWAKQNRFNTPDQQMFLRGTDFKGQMLLNEYRKRLFTRYQLSVQENHYEIEPNQQKILWKSPHSYSNESIIQKLQEIDRIFESKNNR